MLTTPITPTPGSKSRTSPTLDTCPNGLKISSRFCSTTYAGKLTTNRSNSTFLLRVGFELEYLANRTQILCVLLLGIVPFKSSMAMLASPFLSNLMKPTPLELFVDLSNKIRLVIILPTEKKRFELVVLSQTNPKPESIWV